MREIEPDLVWPRLLGWPSDTPLVYLDLNQWIYLAQAQVRAPRDLDHLFHAIVITDSTAS